MIRLAVGATLALAFVLAAVSSVGAQGSDVRIAELDCGSDPEMVVIENQGDASQQFVGWKLLSDPPETEVFELIVLGGLASGASITIQSGPSASGIFIWTTDEVFREGDPTDYVRIVDDAGAVIHEVSCGDEAAPSPTVEPSPPSDVPNGGGVPPVSGGVLSPLIMILSGGSIFAAGLAAITLPWLRLRRPLLIKSAAPLVRGVTTHPTAGSAAHHSSPQVDDHRRVWTGLRRAYGAIALLVARRNAP